MSRAVHRFLAVVACVGLGASLAALPGDALAPGGGTRATPDAVHAALVEHLARRYDVAAGPARRIVETAYRAARWTGLDPILVLAVIAVESSFDPIAESAAGARGLMQIIPKYHRKKLAAHGGERALLDPVSNILVGTEILRDYVRRTGSLQAGLQYYNGASRDASARYTRKVMAERRRLLRAAGAAAI